MASRVPQLRASLQRRILAAADQVALRMEALAIQKAPKASSQLQGRIHGKGIQTGQKIASRLECDSPYGVYAEKGTGPAVGHARYMPPPGALRQWVQRKLSPPAVQGDADPVKALENIIRWSIYHKGTKPKPFMAPAAVLGRREFPKAVRAAVRAGIREVARA